MKIFLGFSEVAGFNSNLKKGFDELGIESSFISFGKTRFKYEIDNNHNFFKEYLQIIAGKFTYYSSSKNKFLYIIFMFLHLINRIVLFLWAICKFDVFIISHSGSFLSYYDLPILKLLKKKLIFIYFGSDSRPAYINGGLINSLSCQEIANISKKTYNNISKVEKYADYIVNVPPQGHFFSREMINAIYLGIPMEFDSSFNASSEDNRDNNFVKILHCPSARKLKGSDEILKIILELKEEGFEIEYKEITNVSNLEVLQEIQKCDILIDELYSDAPMSGIAKEAAYFSKPVLVAGYYSQFIPNDVLQTSIPPTSYVLPEEFRNELIKLIKNKELREKKGELSKSYMEKTSKPVLVARNFINLVNGKAPPEYFFIPQDIKYYNGWGISNLELKIFLKKYVKEMGDKALFLDKSPKLKQRFLDFINDK